MVKCKRGHWYHIIIRKGKEIYKPAINQEHAEHLQEKWVADKEEGKRQTQYILGLNKKERMAYMERAMCEFEIYIENKIEEIRGYA